jgi:serine/threonine protein phosphatase PrpC
MEHTLERLISASAALRRLRLEARTPHVAEDGTTRSSEVAIEHVQLWPGDRILLCTNGLTDVVGDEQISDALAAQRHPDEDTQRLVDIAVSLGATDDVTVLLADYRIPAPPLTLAAP